MILMLFFSESNPLRRRRDDKNIMTPLTMNVTNVTQTPTQPQRSSMIQETSTGFVYNLIGGDMSKLSPGGRSGSPAPETMPSVLNPAKEEYKLMENQARQLAGKIRVSFSNSYTSKYQKL